MKRSIAVFTVVVALTVSGLALAQTQDKGKEMMGGNAAMMEGKGGMMGMMGGKGMMGMMGMHQMQEMMEKMHQTVVATSDGGIIIVGAAKITKYDKDLNVIKEVELKENADAMHEMMEKCSGMMGKGMMGNDKDEDVAPANASAAPASDVDHASHH